MKKKSGFTLLETVITMMIISIISVAVYEGYIMLIRTTKDGEVKQQAALVGKKVVEEINNDSITSYDDDIYFDKDGNEQKSKENYRYVAKISRDKYKDRENSDISIGNTSNTYMYYVYDSGIFKEKKTDKKDKFDKNIEINVKKDSGEKEGSISEDVITFRHDDDSEEDAADNKNINIALNFEAASEDSNIKVEVNNECKAVVNLYILNSKINDKGDKNVTVKNNKGKLNKIYKNGDSAGSISGTLYKITVAVSGRNSRGTMQDNLFKTEVLKNLRE